VDGCAVKLARCCNPLPGDKIIGFITKGYGISIHKKDCPNVVQNMRNLELGDRWLEAHWDIPEGNGSELFETTLQVTAENRAGLLADIINALSDMKVALESVNTQKKNEMLVLISLGVGCKSLDHMKSIVSRLKTIRCVEKVERGFI